MTTILHLSDTHFGTEVPEVMKALADAARKLDPEVVVVSGDITQRARQSQFDAAARFLNTLRVGNRVVIPGNHDIPLFNLAARAAAPYRNYERTFGPRETVWSGPRVCIVGIDATSPLRHTRGTLDQDRLRQALEKARAAMAPEGLLIACIHQPMYTAWPEDAAEILIDARRSAQICCDCGVDAILSGHVHVPLAITSRDVFPELRRHFILAGAGTAVSNRVRPGAPNSFNALRVGPANRTQPCIDIERFDFDPGAGRFVMRKSHEFHLSVCGWSETANTNDIAT